MKPESISGADLIARERQRQISKEGYSPEHDDAHSDCELIDAALCYAHAAGEKIAYGPDHPHINDQRQRYFSDEAGETFPLWPWEPGQFKNTNPIRNLVKAGALIAAEIDRLSRQDSPPEILVKTPPPPYDTPQDQVRSASNP